MSSRTLKEAIDKIIEAEPGWKAFQPAAAQGGRPGKRSTGRPSSGTKNTAAALAETDYNLRQYWPAVSITSTDGVFVLQPEPIKSIQLQSGAFSFQQPTA